MDKQKRAYFETLGRCTAYGVYDMMKMSVLPLIISIVFDIDFFKTVYFVFFVGAFTRLRFAEVVNSGILTSLIGLQEKVQEMDGE